MIHLINLGNIFILSHRRRGEKKKTKKWYSRENVDFWILNYFFFCIIVAEQTTVQGTAVIVPHTFCILTFSFRFRPPFFFKTYQCFCYTIE